MGIIRDGFASAFRDYSTTGVPATGAHDVDKPEARALGDLIESVVSGLEAGLLRYATVALMNANVAAPAGQLAYVYLNNGVTDDPANGVYQRSGGAWVLAPWYFNAVAGVLQPLIDAANANVAASNAALAPFAPFTELPALFGATVKLPQIIETNTNVEHRAYIPFNTTNGVSYIARFIVKSFGRPYFSVFSNAGVFFSATFDLEAGVCENYTAGGTATIKPLGNGWYECVTTVAATAAAVGTNLQLRLHPSFNSASFTYAGDGNSGIRIAGASLTAANAPNAEILASPYLTNAAWTKDGVTASTIIVVNPSLGAAVDANTVALAGILTGTTPILFTENNANDEHRLYKSQNYTTGKTYRYWAVVKANGRTRFNLWGNSASLLMNGVFDLSTGQVISGTGAKITSRGNNEYLVEVTRTATATSNTNIQLRSLDAANAAPYAGDSVSGFYISSAGWEEDGTLIDSWNTTALLSATWTKQGGAAVLATGVKFQSLSQRVDALSGGGSGNAGSLLTGKKWTAMGTSQTIGGAYTAPLAALSGMNLTNIAVSGTTFSSGGSNMSSGINNQVPNIPLDAEVVTVEGLINDHYFNVPVGALTDTTLATFYGALYVIWKGIAARVPNAKVVFIMGTPGCGTGTNAAGRNSRSINTAGFYVRDYQEAMRRFCENESVLLTAVGQRAGINDTNGDRLLSDGLHYNSTGGALVAAYANDDMQTMVRRGMLI